MDTLHAVMKQQGFFIAGKAPGCRRTRDQLALTTGTRVDGAINTPRCPRLNLPARTCTGIGPALRLEFSQGRLIVVMALMLPEDRAIPFKTQPFQLAQDLLSRPGHRPGRVQIFNPH